jgi:hypothetical protein
MTIHLPEDVLMSVKAEVLSGRFASEHDLVAEAVRDYLRKNGNPEGVIDRPEGSDAGPPRDDRPIWEYIEELVSKIPPEELAKLPVDGAKQHDHYLYGSPKRP